MKPPQQRYRPEKRALYPDSGYELRPATRIRRPRRKFALPPKRFAFRRDTLSRSSVPREKSRRGVSRNGSIPSGDQAGNPATRRVLSRPQSQVHGPARPDGAVVERHTPFRRVRCTLPERRAAKRRGDAGASALWHLRLRCLRNGGQRPSVRISRQGFALQILAERGNT
jgi:hypothetical protein